MLWKIEFTMGKNNKHKWEKPIQWLRLDMGSFKGLDLSHDGWDFKLRMKKKKGARFQRKKDGNEGGSSVCGSVCSAHFGQCRWPKF